MYFIKSNSPLESDSVIKEKNGEDNCDLPPIQDCSPIQSNSPLETGNVDEEKNDEDNCGLPPIDDCSPIQKKSPQEKEEDYLSLFQRLQPQEQKVVHTLKASPGGLHIDELSWRTEIPINQLASVLLTLEFQGMVHALPGKKFSLQQ